ncbi:MAG: hypothetical protein U9R74_03790 [Pseudomonadota bacterium]|nr:hypothetical protein [Pseudomonadota bacterium]
MNAQPKDRERQEKAPYALMSTFIVGRMSKGLASNLANALRRYLGSREGFVSDTFIIRPGHTRESR